MIYDPLNSLIFFPLIQVVVFLFLHFHSPALTRDRQDNRNYREIKFSTTSFPVGPHQPVPRAGVKLHMQHGRTLLSADACSRRVSGLYSVWLAYFVLCSDLVWQLTEGWEQRSCRPWSARRNSWDTPRQGESYLVTPTLPSPVTVDPHVLSTAFPCSLLSACSPLTGCSPLQMLFSLSFSHLLLKIVEVYKMQLYLANTEMLEKYCLVTLQLFYGVVSEACATSPWINKKHLQEMLNCAVSWPENVPGHEYQTKM